MARGGGTSSGGRRANMTATRKAVTNVSGGSGRRRRNVAAQASGAERVTRSSRAKLTNGLEDPAQVEKELNAQLRSMGLYAANITGDGNCLFRALSDQLYGFPHQHTQIRQSVCDYLEARSERFAGFVEVEKPFDEYIRSMRQSGTYGGHLEISAFAILKQKEIKIVQPGLVYVISGDDESPQAVKERQRREKERELAQSRSVPGSEGPPPSERTLRRLRRTSKDVADAAGQPSVFSKQHVGSSPNAAASTESIDEVDRQTASASTSTDVAPPAQIEAHGPLWIAYHSWEHYSSIRNIEGPHAGLPRINEKRANMNAHGKTQSGPSALRSSASGSGSAHEDADESDAEPTEEESLVLRSTNGYTLQQVRFYIKRHGGWEEALEAILANELADGLDDKEDGEMKEHPAAWNEGNLALQNTRPDAVAEEAASSGHIDPHGGFAIADRSRLASHSPIPDHLRDWRAMSPSSVDTNGTHSSAEGASASTHATTDDSPEVSGSGGKHVSERELRRSKRTASRDPTANVRSPKRRSRSRSPSMPSGSNGMTDVAGIVAANAIANMSVHSGEHTPTDMLDYASSPLGRLMTDESGNDDSASMDSESVASRSHLRRSKNASQGGGNGHGTVEDPDKTPRAKMHATPRPVKQVLTMRERREMRKAEQIRRALDAKSKRQQRSRAASSRAMGDDEEDDEDEDDDRTNNADSSSSKRSGFLKQKHAADVKGFLELKI